MIWHLFICFSNTPGTQNGLGGLKDAFVKNPSWPSVSLLFFFKVTIQNSKRLWVPRPWPWVHLSQPHWFRRLLFHTPLLPPRPIALLPLPWTRATSSLGGLRSQGSLLHDTAWWLEQMTNSQDCLQLPMSEQLAFQELPPWYHPLWTFPSLPLSYTLSLAGWVIHCSRSLSQFADFQAIFIPPKIQPTDCLKIQIIHLIRWAFEVGHPIALRWT